ncbi:hypothetical protein QQP08_007121 [Theobroma cacao]|nr:hypothetical protein QQP08_007121 [Theobroma cacao]
MEILTVLDCRLILLQPFEQYCVSVSAATLPTEMKAADLAVAGVILVCCFICLVIFRGSSSKKTMKAPGRNNRIYRDDFTRNPKGYFRDLRKRKG